MTAPSPGPKRLLFAVSSTEILDSTWTTIHLAAAALQRGDIVRFTEPHSLEVTAGGRVVTRAWVADSGPMDRETLAQALVQGTLPYRHVELVAGDTLVLRVNPLTPSMLNFALVAQDLGMTVINDPAGVALTRSKAWLATLADVPRPATVVTSSRAAVHHFARTLKQPVVIKPASSSGGRGVQLVASTRASRLDDALDAARIQAAGGHIIVQEYLEAASDGEKRLVWVSGHILGAYLRRRGPEDFRHNLRNGAQPEPCTIDEQDRRIAAAIGPHLIRNGIRIAGLDVIGGRLVEVNTLNPGGIHYAEETARIQPGALARSALRLLTANDPHPDTPVPAHVGIPAGPWQ